MEILLIAIALAMDAVAISLVSGTKCFNIKISQILLISFVYGIFQAFMPILGYFFGLSFAKFIESIDHFIAFLILGYIGIKMIKDSFEKNDEDCILKIPKKELILGAFATSIDALAVGVTFAFEKVNIWLNSLIIGFVCFVLCIIACFIGKKIGGILHQKALILGGAILIFIGIKILITHLGLL